MVLYLMNSRMNSKQLKNNYREVYESFFQKNQIVLSAPFLMTWAGDLSKSYSGITIKQKIPLRIYLGVNKNKSGRINLNEITYREKTTNNFLTTNILEYAPHFFQLDRHINENWRNLLNNKE